MIPASLRGLAVVLLLAGGGALAAPGPAAVSSPAAVSGAASGAPGVALPAAVAAFGLTGEMTQGGWARGLVPPGTVALAFNGVPVPFGADGRFFLAFDRDAAPAATLVARLQTGASVSRALAISPRSWRIERVDIPQRGGGPTEAFMAIRAPELARIRAARGLDSGSQGWRQRFVWPATGRVSGLFGSQRIYRGGVPGSFHSGIDIAGATGTPFVAPADGVVILAAASPFTLEGKLLMIDHGMGLNSAFLHCSQLLVQEGQAVRQGQVIGRIGMTGRATGPHLHWSLKWRDARLDPLLFTGPMR